MTKRLLPIERKRAAALKIVRAAVRLKYSLLADEELDTVLQEVEDAFNKALAKGKPFELDLNQWMKP